MGFACSGVPTFQEISQEGTRYSRVHPGFQITHRRALITAPWTKSTLSQSDCGDRIFRDVDEQMCSF